MSTYRKEWITFKQYELAEAKYDTDFYMLTDSQQTEVHNLAEEYWNDRYAETIERQSSKGNCSS